MALGAGTKLGPYEIIGALGAGGMGEVYRAKDTRLGREVAVKVLPPTFANDPDRLRRFEVEARTVAALNHPNILALFDIGEHDGAPYLVCELLEGVSLRQRMDGGPLGQSKAVEYASQIAHGLAAAHDKDVVHRDLKPDNVFLTNDGQVKILDFGLAKLARTQGTVAGAEDKTVDERTPLGQSGTTPGLVLGTVGYMSPEQVRGKEVDARTDIFSFGAVLYEMLSGRRAFRGESSVETMNAILKEEPEELTATGLHVSPGLERLVRRCLEKNPKERFQSARDLAFALEALSHSTSSATFPAKATKPGWKKWLVIAAALLAVAAITILLATRNRAPVGTQYFAIPVANEVSHMAISRDGKLLAFVSADDATGQRELFVQAIGSKTARPLPGSENALFPFWSPDNQYLGFFANRKLLKVRVAGGAPQQLAVVSTPRGGAWSNKGVIVFAPDSGGALWRINADGTGLASLTGKMLSTEVASHRWPQFLPDGDHYIFWAGNFNRIGDQNGIWIGSLAAEPIRFVQATLSNAAYTDPGKLVYVGEKGQVLMVDFDPKSGTVRGEARVIAEGVAYDSSLYWAAFTVSQNGILVSNTSAAASLSQLTWVDRSGRELGTLGAVGLIFNPSISPDGRRIAEDIDDVAAANVDIWIRDLERGTATRFTFDPGEDATPVWSPDGSNIAYRNFANINLKPANGLERERIWSKAATALDDRLPNSWTPDGKGLIFTSTDAQGGDRLMLLKASDTTAARVIAGNFNQTNGQISSDGKWLAYASDESGTWEVYVTNFPGLGGKWQVSQGGGTEPRWRRDTKELFYVNAKGVLSAVQVGTENGFSIGASQPLFPLRARMALSSTDRFSYDVTRDGQKFLVNRYMSPEHPNPLGIAIGIAATEGAK